MIAKCGIDCSKCEAYLATIQNSDELRKETAEKWSSMFGAKLDYKSINCLGCQESDENKLIGHCKVCEIRICALEKGYNTCADCENYGCDLVSKVWQHDSKIKANLDELRNK